MGDFKTCDCPSGSNGPCASEADQSTIVFIPQGEAGAFEAFKEFDLLGDSQEFGTGVKAFLQTIVGNGAVEMMDVVQSDITGQPLYDPGQDIVRAAEHASQVKIPVFLMLPIGVFILMLDKEHPATDNGSNSQGWQIDHQEGYNPKSIHGTAKNEGESNIQSYNAFPDFSERQGLPERQPLDDGKMDWNTNDKQYNRIAIKSVFNARHKGKGAIFLDCQG